LGEEALRGTISFAKVTGVALSRKRLGFLRTNSLKNYGDFLERSEAAGSKEGYFKVFHFHASVSFQEKEGGFRLGRIN